jgi:CPA2 family monovalent cation:H+ antiporter-2
VPVRRVLRLVQEQRDARYRLLRGYFHGADDDTVQEMHSGRLLSVTLPLGIATGAHRLADLVLHSLDVNVVSVRRAGGAVVAPADDLALSGGDTLVLSGLPEPLALAEAKLLALR